MRSDSFGWETRLRVGLVVLLALALPGALPSAPAQTVVRLRPATLIQAEPAEDAAKPDGDAAASAPTTPDGAAPQSAPASQPVSTLAPAELERLRKVHASLAEKEKAEMLAYFQDMGVDLATLLGLKKAAPAGPAKSLPDAVRGLDFSRKADAVLAARSQLGFAASVMPDLKNSEPLAKWLHMNVLAGQWDVLGQLLPLLSSDDATAVYSHILRSTNEGAQNLLPEEVLALGDACPGEMADWQLDVLAQMLKNAAAGYGTAQFLERVRAGTRLFGAQDDAHRERTARLLVGAGLAQEAYEYLPPLEAARERQDARVVYGHARYYQDLLAAGREAEREDEYLAKSWALLGEVALMSSADVALRKDAMRRAIDLLTRVSPSQADEWLAKVFASEALGPAALEIVALQAMSFRDKKADAARRAQGIATMKSAVDTLLAQPSVNVESLRVPLRMLTTALADEVDAVVKEKGDIRGVARETDILYRARPDERWLGAIEPSAAIRGYRAAIAIATVADETDVALDVLAAGVRRFPAQGVDFADDFLKLWERRLNPRGRPGEQDMDNPYILYYGQQRVPAAPLTRGRQRRNLDRLEHLLTLLEGMGVDARKLPSVTAAFKACHARTEVFDGEQIVRVFGPIEQVSARTAAALAESMRAGLSGDWRNRQVQRQYGMMRSRAEIGELVEVGYELAIELAERARAQEPDSWEHAALHAALSYDRMQYKQSQQKQDFATYNEYRRAAFAAFEKASLQYADLVAKGVARDNSGVYLRWFSAVLDAGEPAPDAKTDSAAEQAASDDQIDRIAAAMQKLPAEAYERHVASFARDVVDALGAAPPEKKPGIVRGAVRIVGDHPAGAPLRRLYELYEDLLRNEIRMRFTVDGADRVAKDELFAVTLTLRYTNSVDRETGGFDKYLYQDAFVRVGNQYRNINYQAQLRRAIEGGLGQGFTIESVAFFDPLTPSRSVHEEGQIDWQEKPMAYILLRAKDPSVDRLPSISFDMHFDDTSGPVTLPIVSNSPPIDATGSGGRRPAKNLAITQTVDARRLVTGTDDRAVMLEVHAKADGVVPELRDLLDGIDDALPGYRIADGGVETRPLNVVQREEGNTSRRYFPFGQPGEEKTDFVKPDENGIYRLGMERSWLITYKPTGAAVADRLTLPRLAAGVDAKLLARQFADMDVVDVASAAIAVAPRWSLTTWISLGVGAALLIGVALWAMLRRRRGTAVVQGDLALPARITPLSVIAALERMHTAPDGLDLRQRAALAGDIAEIQQAHFGPNGHAPRLDESAMRSVLQRWAAALRGERPGSEA